VTPNPKAALALVRGTTELTGIPADVSELETASVAYEERVSEMVATDEDVQAYVSLLEERADERADEEQIHPSELPTADALAAEVERFLQQRENGG
jgi:predicted ATP-grasp superfamily ATP-dependent carboligase